MTTQTAHGGTQAVDRAAALLTYVVEADHPVTFAEVDRGRRASPGRRPRGCSRRWSATSCSSAPPRGSTSADRCSFATPPATTATSSWPGWHARCSSRSVRRPARTCTSRSPTATGSTTSPRSTRRTCWARATGPTSRSRRTPPRSARCCWPGARCARPCGRLETPTQHTLRTRHLARDGPRPGLQPRLRHHLRRARGRAHRRRGTGLRTRRGPSSGWSPPWASRARRHGSRDGSRSSAVC